MEYDFYNDRSEYAKHLKIEGKNNMKIIVLDCVNLYRQSTSNGSFFIQIFEDLSLPALIIFSIIVISAFIPVISVLISVRDPSTLL